MAICPHCQTRSEVALSPCPTGDGYYTVPDEAYQADNEEGLLGWPVGGRFVVTELIGQGSMARVFRTHQINVERDVALKVFEAKRLAEDLTSTNTEETLEHARMRFAQEAKVLAKLSHPNCVTLFDYGVGHDGEFIYIAMEHVSGMSLRRAIKRGLKGDAVIEITQQILLALREAHALGIVHRDLKPENIILTLRFSTEEQLVKVVDFGIAKMIGPQDFSKTKVGTLFGTPAYMSPEQCRGESDTVGPHSDMYSLGCILYEMVCGRMPYEERTPQGMVLAHTTKPVPAIRLRPGLELPDGFTDFITRMLQKDAADRYDSGQAALKALNALLVPGSAGPITTSEMMRLRASQVNASPTRVVVPQNQIRGDDLSPTTSEHDVPSELVARVIQRSADTSGENIFATQDGSTAKAADVTGPRLAKSGPSIWVRLAVGLGLIVVVGFCVALFFYIYQSIMGS